MQNRRKKLMVDKPFQGPVIVAIAWPLSLTIAIVALFLGVVCGQLDAESRALGIDTPTISPTMLSIVGLVAIAIGTILFLALKISHKIAGPSYRIRETMKAVRNGDLSCRARIRKGDYLRDVADELNDFLDWVEENAASNPELSKAATPSTAEADEHVDAAN